ncbi:hypothetical protein ON010_g15977 [Phytophthora cinnamomi]|nr:hypothetical protein ON010_g15977 [Phytophthora cinnamomi]
MWTAQAAADPSSRSGSQDNTKYTLAVFSGTLELSPPKRSRANTDGDAGSNGVRPKGVTLQEPPLITSFAHEDLVKWKRKRVLYENAVENRCAETEEAIAAVRRSVQKSTNNMLLKSFSEYELRIPVENVTEETLLAAIGHITGSEMSAAMPDVTRVVVLLQITALVNFLVILGPNSQWTLWYDVHAVSSSSASSAGYAH